MSRTVPDTVRELLLSLPATAETTSHGTPTFQVSGKSFAHFMVNHHGDRRVGLWLALPVGRREELQEPHAAGRGDAYFTPPYVGPQGWVGVDLGALFSDGLSWGEVVRLAREAWAFKAPARLRGDLDEVAPVAPPDTPMAPEEVDPLLRSEARAVLDELARRCRRLPETQPAKEWGCPSWKAGKRSFVRVNHRDGRLKLQFWVGVGQQPFFAENPRYTVPLYFGPRGWIELDVQDTVNWDEVQNLLLNSYRHFALKRMLKALDEDAAH